MADEGEREDAAGGGLVDAEQFLRVSAALKRTFATLDQSPMPEPARQRWQRRLIAITDLAKHDLDRAEQQYERFRADLDRDLDLTQDRGGAVEDR